MKDRKIDFRRFVTVLLVGLLTPVVHAESRGGISQFAYLSDCIEFNLEARSKGSRGKHCMEQPLEMTETQRRWKNADPGRMQRYRSLVFFGFGNSGTSWLLVNRAESKKLKSLAARFLNEYDDHVKRRESRPYGPTGSGPKGIR